MGHCDYTKLSEYWCVFTMENFSNADYTDIYFVYGQGEGNGTLISRLYDKLFSNRPHLWCKMFATVHNRLKEGVRKGHEIC